MELVHPLVEAYAEKYSSPINMLLEQIQRETVQTHPHAHMISSPIQGKMLSFLSRMIQPKYLKLEVLQAIVPFAWQKD
jgi:caffeoyl-CoA O-methyltransferase